MKRLIAAIVVLFVFAVTCWPLMALAAEPKNVSAVRDDFLKAVKENGMDVKKCELKFLETVPEGHLIQTACADLPNLCLFLVHPTEALARPLQCIPNPEYTPSTKI